VTARDVEEYRPAGVVTRLLAVVVDTVVVIAAVFGIELAIVAVLFAWSPARFTWPDSWLAWTGLLFWWLAVLYLTVAWATIGRTYGAQLLGLRVLSGSRGLLGWPRAALRAVLCVVFPVGLLWAVVSRRRRSVQDILVRSIVVYDWHQDGGLRASASADAAPDRITP
jgi:uncharacterized RDD family membrane protein YckC